jgi:GntR family transcriptional repressor for pyruvate dehydrogenase complex
MTTGLGKIPKPESVASEVLKSLIDYLFSGQVQPGDKIPSERQLTEELGVNRPAVRQALLTLSFLGLLDIRPGSGTYFRDPDQALLFTLFELSLTFGEPRLRDLVETRTKLETLVAGMAAERRTDAEVDELRELLAQMERSLGEEFVEADMAFHARIAECSRNRVLIDMLKGVRTMVRSWIGSTVLRRSSTEIMFADHVPIFEGIAEGDPERAQQAMAAHMAGATSRLDPAFFTQSRIHH